MIDWKKFAAEHGQYVTAWKAGKLYIAGPTELGSHYALVVDMPEKMDMERRAEKVKPVADRIEANRRTNLIPLSEIIGNALDGYVQTRVECDCVGGECYECNGGKTISHMDKRLVWHEIECPVCDGVGELGKGPVPGCSECEGLGYWMEWPQQTVDYKSWYFAKAVLRVLSLLPGTQVAIGITTDSTHYLKFEGGEGVFMGLSRPFES